MTDIAKAITTDPEDAPKKKRTPRTFEQRVEALVTPQRNAYERALKRRDKVKAELDQVQAEFEAAERSYKRAKDFAESTAEREAAQ